MPRVAKAKTEEPKVKLVEKKAEVEEMPSGKIDIPNMVVVSKVKEFVSEQFRLRTGSDFVSALNDVVARLINEGARRCDSNGRQTLRADDL